MGFLRRLTNTTRRETLDRDMQDELAYHIEQKTAEYVRRGMTQEEARLAARRQLGNATGVREKTADADLLVWLEAGKRDILHGLRTLGKSKLFASIAILSLALGIGANTVVFTVLKHVVLDSLPVPEADQLVILHNRGVQEGHISVDGMESAFSFPLYRDLNHAAHSIFSGILAFTQSTVTLSRNSGSDRIACAMISGNYFDVLRVKPWRGRLLGISDDQRRGAHPVAVISYGFWQREFGGDAGILGRTLRLNGHPFQVVGIAPPRFYGVRMDWPADVYAPVMMRGELTDDSDGLDDRLYHWASLVARLYPGETLAHAQAALSVIYPPLRDQDIPLMPSVRNEFLREFKRGKVQLTPGGKGYASIRESLREPLQFIEYMVVLLLMITVVNVANLLIARSIAREREMAVRMSVGAGRPALVRQLLIESVTLALIGGVAGVGLAFAATPVVLRLLGSQISEASVSAAPDGFVLGLTTLVTVGCGVVFGLLPALQSSRTDVACALKSEGSTGHTSGRLWLRRTLVAGQIGFSLVLLTAALLFGRSLANLRNINPGFETRHLLRFDLSPDQAGYSVPHIKSLGEEVRHRLEALPGVESAAIATVPLLEDDSWGADVTVEGLKNSPGFNNNVLQDSVSPQFFSTMRIPILQGRPILNSDSMANSKFAVVNSTFVRHFLGNTNPIGKRFSFGTHDDPKLDWTIVGVAADNEHRSLRAPVEPMVYLPYLQSDALGGLTFYVRSKSSESGLENQIRPLMRNIDPSLPVDRLKSVTQLIDDNLLAERGLAMMSTAFALLAVTLAAIGLYGVVAYSVTRRKREFGIRMAIGATPVHVLGTVLRETAILAAISIACATPIIIGAGRLVQSSLYGISPANPLLCGGAAALLFAIAIASGLLPASSAARIDPHAALRAE